VNTQAILNPHQWLLARYAAQVRLDPRGWGSTRRLIETAHRILLLRSVSPSELATWMQSLQRGEAKWTGLIWQILCSDEFQTLHSDWSLPYDPIRVQNALHAARCLLIRHELPSAHRIVDLGGACTESIAGALLWMGYPHPAQEITIIDLPPQTRMFADHYHHLESEHRDWIEVEGTRVRYIHASMTDLSSVADESIDLLWMGQSIEHITQAQARHVYAEARRVLKPGGYFCLDTPNRDVTRLLYPFSYIHPEHKHEYTVTELLKNLAEAGFNVKRTLGICPLPRSTKEGRLYLREIPEHVELSENASMAYFFYIESIKRSS
jgi:ubiquinone/menaquinone biosynthesis C-methylase UbiE